MPKHPLNRRHFLQGAASLPLLTALPFAAWAATPSTVGFIRVGAKDDFG